jgi:hypothetical protein
MYLIAVLYVSIGLALALLSVTRRDPLGTFLGFLIVSGALGGAVVLATVLKLSSQSELLAGRLEDLAGSLGRIEQSLAGPTDDERHRTGAACELDLSRVGPGDPTILTAATLDRAVYPRLLRAMEDEPPARSAEPRKPAWPAQVRAGAAGSHGDAIGGEAAMEEGVGGPATKNLLAQWRRAVRSGDLASCRAVYSALVDMASADQLAPLRHQMQVLAEQVEHELRDRFARSVRERNFAAALSAGEDIGRLLADRPVAQEFNRLRPYLMHKVHGESQGPRSKAQS